MAAYKRSDPKKLAADRDAIAQQMQKFDRIERVNRSAEKAKQDAAEFRKTGEGTMPEAFHYLMEKAAEKRYDKKYGSPPNKGGAIIGRRAPSNRA